MEAARLLLVDDEPAILKSVGRFLRRAGYTVEAVATGNEALQALKRDRFDGIIADMRMPGFSGQDLFALVEAEYPDIARRVVFTSGDMNGHRTQEFVAASGCPSLQKPYEFTELLAVLRDLIRA